MIENAYYDTDENIISTTVDAWDLISSLIGRQIICNC